LTFEDVTQQTTSTSLAVQHHPAPGVCVGRPPAHVELHLFAPQSHEAPEGGPIYPVHEAYTVGLIASRGPHVMSGYWGQRGRRSTDWYTTTDFGYWDDQRRLYFCGRQTDTIRTGGETVWARQVEEILLQHKDIREVAVLGLPDDRFGETVACAVVWQAATSPVHLSEIRQWCRSQGLAGFKQPRRMATLASLPRNSSGKIVKGHLKDCFRDDAPTSRL
jgi:fatty-acyl-CoA synthase